MKKVLTTLSLGAEYTSEYTIRLIKDVLELSSLDLYVTTNCRDVIEGVYGQNERIKIKDINLKDVKIRIPMGENKGGDDFNFNLKYLCFEPVMKFTDALILYTDCDNSFDWWDEQVVEEYTTRNFQQGFDFLAPRAGLTVQTCIDSFNAQCEKDETHYQSSTLIWHKFFNYDMVSTSPLRVSDSHTPKWGPAGLPAEHLLLFYNTGNKLEKFVEQWKWFHDYLVNREYTWGTWAEAFEIGVSAYLAGFNVRDIGYSDPVWGKIITFNGYKTGPKGGKVYATLR